MSKKSTHLKLVVSNNEIESNDSFTQIKVLVAAIDEMRTIMANVQNDPSYSVSEKAAKLAEMRTAILATKAYTATLSEECLEELQNAA